LKKRQQVFSKKIAGKRIFFHESIMDHLSMLALTTIRASLAIACKPLRRKHDAIGIIRAAALDRPHEALKEMILEVDVIKLLRSEFRHLIH
jgi:hypothetical protein